MNKRFRCFWMTTDDDAWFCPDVRVQLDFHDEFLIRSIRVVFVSPGAKEDSSTDMRPMAIEFQARRLDEDATYRQPQDWQTWRCYAVNCTRYFPNVTHVSVNQYDAGLTSDGATIPACIEKYYAGDLSTNGHYGWGLQEVSEYDAGHEAGSSRGVPSPLGYG